MKKLKILLVINVRWYNAEADYCMKLARALRALGMEITVMGADGSPALRAAREEGFDTVTSVNLNSLNPLSVILNYFRFKAHLQKRRYDVVNFFRSEGFITGALACRAAKTKVVRTRGDTRPVRKGFFNRLLYNDLTAFIIASGEIVKKGLVERLNVPEEKIRTVYTAVDTGYFTPGKKSGKLRRELDITEHAKIVAILGRLGYIKGHDLFLKAAGIVKLRRKDVVFLIAGRPVDSEPLDIDAMIIREGLAGDVRVILERRDDIDELAASVDIGAITSTASEVNCRVAMEWMSSGVPVVGFATGVIPEVVKDGEDGFIVPTGDYEALADRILLLIEDDPRRGRFSENARKNAESRFDTKKFGLETLKIYNNL